MHRKWIDHTFFSVGVPKTDAPISAYPPDQWTTTATVPPLIKTPSTSNDRQQQLSTQSRDNNRSLLGRTFKQVISEVCARGMIKIGNWLSAARLLCSDSIEKNDST